MKKLFTLILIIITGCSTSAQTTCSIKKAYAYYNSSMPGMQMVDENGNRIDPKPNITRFIYVEYSGVKMPVISSVVYKGEALVFTVTEVKTTSVTIGDEKLNTNNSITAKKGNKLMKIDLQPQDAKAMPSLDCKSISIKYKTLNKNCTFYITGEKQYFMPPMG